MSRERLISLCVQGLKAKKVYGDPRYKKRLILELKEVDGQNENDYFLKIHDNGKTGVLNEHNLLIPYLLGICDDFDIEKQPVWQEGEYPDIDIDYLPEVREYLKNEYAFSEFGEKHVCHIANYNTFGIRSSLIDMARVFEKDRGEILVLTKALPSKNEDGNPLSWENALKFIPGLIEYADKNPDVVDAARRLMSRNRAVGQHASGLIISGPEIEGFVPLVKNKDGYGASAWVEGLHGTDLSEVGLVKLDFLNLDANQKIAIAEQLILRRHPEIKSLCDKDGLGSWSDIAYLNDPQSLKLADSGDLKMIFQFDSPGIKALVKKGGVQSFDDLVAYSALYRPACLQMGMHDTYIKRKKGQEEYKLHPVLQPILGDTYGVMCYQEQTMRILNAIGEIPLKDCESVRKAISKKKIDKFKKYKDQFIINGQKALGVDRKEVEEFWRQIEAFSGYGFNKCVVGSTAVMDAENGSRYTVKELYNMNNAFGKKIKIHALDDNWKIQIDEVTNVVNNGKKPVFELTLDTNRKIVVTDTHRFFTFDGWKPLSELNPKDMLATARILEVNNNKRVSKYHVLGMVQDAINRDRVPSEVYELCDADLELFVGKFWSEKGRLRPDSDAWVPTCYFKTQQLPRDMLPVLLRLGISARIGRRKVNGGAGKRMDSLGLLGLESHRKFLERVIPHYIDKEKEVKFFEYDVNLSKRDMDYIPLKVAKVIGDAKHVAKGKLHTLMNRYGYAYRNKVYNRRGVHRKVVQKIGEQSGHEDLIRMGNSEIFWSQIKSIEPAGEQETFDLSMKTHHNFTTADGIIAHNSHSVAYTYISSRMLWLKAHYSLEFCTAVLQQVKSGPDVDSKRKNYILDAQRRGISIEKVNLNKSDVDFEIVDDKIYYGFSKIKGIGEDVAQKIVDLQPYSSFEDFLRRFGTEAKVVQPLICLGVFDGNPLELCKFYEFYKKNYKKELDRTKRYNNSVSRYEKEFSDLVKSIDPSLPGVIEDFEFLNNFVGCNEKWKEIVKIKKKYDRCVENYKKKCEKTPECDLDSMEVDVKMKKMLEDPTRELAELEYYGFHWLHPLEKCKDYEGHTFEEFRNHITENSSGPIEVQIKKVRSKKGRKVTYYSLEVEDALCEKGFVTVWKDDYELNKSVLKAKNLVRMRVSPPSGNYSNYTISDSRREVGIDTRVYPLVTRKPE